MIQIVLTLVSVHYDRDYHLVILHLAISLQWRTRIDFVFVCAIPLSASDLELPFPNKHATSLPGDDETEYNHNLMFMCVIQQHITYHHLMPTLHKDIVTTERFEQGPLDLVLYTTYLDKFVQQSNNIILTMRSFADDSSIIDLLFVLPISELGLQAKNGYLHNLIGLIYLYQIRILPKSGESKYLL